MIEREREKDTKAKEHSMKEGRVSKHFVSCTHSVAVLPPGLVPVAQLLQQLGRAGRTRPFAEDRRIVRLMDKVVFGTVFTTAMLGTTMYTETTGRRRTGGAG